MAKDANIAEDRATPPSSPWLQLPLSGEDNREKGSDKWLAGWLVGWLAGTCASGQVVRRLSRHA